MKRSPLFRNLILALQTARQENLKAQGLPTPLPYTDSNWTRRKFIKSTAVLGATGLIGSNLSFSPDANAADKGKLPTIAIIGAGIAGLNAAYQLKKAGYLAIVYEARARVGGRMLSTDLGNGLVVDLGGELINTDHADMLELAEELGVDLFNRVEDAAKFPFPKNAYYVNGVSVSETDLADDLRLLAAQINEDAALIDEDWETYAPQFDALSVADYLELHADKVTMPYVFDLIAEAIRSEYGAETDKSSALQLLFTLPVVDGQDVDLISYSDETYSVVGGSAQITDALGEQLPEQIKLRMVLTEIKKRRGKYQLGFADHAVVEADIVIVTIPFPVLKKVNINVPLPPLLRRFIKEAELGVNEKLIAGFNKRFWRQDSGFTGEAWGDLGFSTMWDETQRQPDRDDAALNFFLGGDTARNSGDSKDADKLGEQFINNINVFISGAKEASTGKFIKSGWLKSPFTAGSYANYLPGQLTRYDVLRWIESEIEDERQQVNVGNLIFAGEHLSDEFYGFMNGGAQTGRLAASLVVEAMAARALS